MSATDGNYGFQELNTGNGDYNALHFVITQLLANMRTSTLVQVIAVDAPTGVNPVGFVDVQCMVNQITGGNTAVAHDTIYSLPYIRIQGGQNAVIVDPEIGDIGLACFADSDISSVKASRAIANPGSFRKFDLADGVFIGGWSSKTPVRYLKIDDNGITVEGDQQVTIHGMNVTTNATTATVNASQIALNGTTTQTGPMTIVGALTVTQTIAATLEITAMGGAHSMSSHTHGNVTNGTGTTSGPTG